MIGHPPTYTSNLVYMCAGGFRGHKLNYLDSFKSYCNSSDLDFLSSGGSGGGGLGGWGWGAGWMGLGGAPHTHAHACACTHAHACVVNMIISCKWPPPLGESLGIPYDVIHMCMCMHVCMHMCEGHPLTTPTHIHPPPHPPGGTPRISQNSIALEVIEIFQFPTHGWVDGWVGGLMGGVRSNH